VRQCQRPYASLLCQLALFGALATHAVAATLHARPDGATAATYTVHVGRNAPGTRSRPSTDSDSRALTR